MTIREWVTKHNGTVLLIPAGTVTGHVWYYQEGGEWTRKPTSWHSGMPKEYREVKTPRDQYVEITIDEGALVSMGRKATENRSGKCTDGPLILKRRR